MRRLAVLEREADVADVDQVKADDEQMIHGIGQLLIAGERIDKEHAAVLMQRAGDEHGQSQAQGQVNAVGPHHNHGSLRWSYLNSLATLITPSGEPLNRL